MKGKNKTVWIILILILVAGSFLIIKYNSPKQNCPTDLNGDRVTDSLDLKILESAYGKDISTSDTTKNADLNGNSIINAEDLSIMIGFLNKPCQ